MSHHALGPQWKPTGMPESGGTAPPKGNGVDSCMDCGAQFAHSHAPNEIYGYSYKGKKLAGGGPSGIWSHLDRSIQKQYGGHSPFGNPAN